MFVFQLIYDEYAIPVLNSLPQTDMYDRCCESSQTSPRGRLGNFRGGVGSILGGPFSSYYLRKMK